MATESRAAQPGVVLHKVMTGHKGMISHLAWEPHGHVLASTGFDKTIRIWDSESGKNLKTGTKHTRNVAALTWAPEGQALATAGDDRKVLIWSYPSMQLLETLDEYDKSINSLAWSPNGKILVSAANSREFHVWDVKNHKLVQMVKGHEAMTRHMSFSEKGEFLASTSDSGRIRVWKTGGFNLYKLLEGHSATVNMSIWTPSDRLVTASDDGTIRVWDPGKGRCLHVLDNHKGPVKAIAVSPDGRLMASKSWDQTLRLWRCDTWQNVSRLEEECVSPMPALAFHPNEPLLASVGLAGQVIRIWEVELDRLSVAQPDPRLFTFQDHELQMLRDMKAFDLVEERAPDRPPPSTGDSVSCPRCHKIVPEREVVRWQSHGYTSVKCPGCEGVVPLSGDVSTLSLREWVGGDHAELVILFSDVVNSTELGNLLGDEEMSVVRRAHFEEARKHIGRYNGYEVKTIGDSFMVVFKDAVQAFKLAKAFRIKTGHEEVKIRQGLHLGEVDIEENDAFGATVNMAARVESKAGSSEIWLSDPMKQRLEAGPGFAEQNWERHPDQELKGFSETFTLWSI